MKRVLESLRWPDGRDFAFTVFDDTDLQTPENTRPVYDFLAAQGYRTTKTVWPIKGSSEPRVGGMTCEDASYRDWALSLQDSGFEIALHNVTYHTSDRQATIEGLERFRDLFGAYPQAHANHFGCREAIYWGSDRVSGLARHLYNLSTLYRRDGYFEGHVSESELFWGDLCHRHIKYVRNFIYGDMNTLSCCPQMPYHDTRRPYVNYWFAASEGPNVESFVGTIDEESQDRLEKEGGACIMYTHFASGFYRDGRLDQRFEYLMRRLSRKNGWFVPVSTLLDYLLEARGRERITAGERRALEMKWLWHKLRVGGTS